MAGSVNKAILVGNLGRDPEIRNMQNGKSVVSFSLATTESWRDKSTGERKDKTEWHNVVIFNENLGKVVEQYARKGSKVYIEGQIQTREYTDKDGNQRKSTEIVLQAFNGAVVLLDAPKRESGEIPRETDRRSSTDAAQPAHDRTNALIDDDIPF